MVTNRRILDGHTVVGFTEWELQRDSAVIPDWLNAANGTESYDRVVKLIDEIRQVESGKDKVVREGWYISWPGKPRSKAALDQLDDLSRRREIIGEILSRYSFSPRFDRVLLERSWMLSMFSTPAPDEYVFERVVHVGEKRLRSKAVEGEYDVYHAYDHEHTVGEADVVLRILNLAAASELERVKQCVRCSKWFYAERSHQRFCPGGECRIAEYSKSRKYKNYRKLYMRRQRAKEAAEKATKPFKGKGR